MVKTGSPGLQGGWHRLLLQHVLPWGASASGAALIPCKVALAGGGPCPLPAPLCALRDSHPHSNPAHSSCSCWQAELCSVQAFAPSCLEEGLLLTLSPRLGQVHAPRSSAAATGAVGCLWRRH